MAECPTCDKQLATQRGVKSHRVQVHDAEISIGRERVSLICERCGESYQKRKDRAENSKFCSGECQRKGRSTRSKSREVRECEVCTDNFTCHPNDGQRFCGTECFHEWRANYMSGSDSPISKEVEVTCSECCESFKRAPSAMAESDEQYCSRECYHQSYTGEDAPDGMVVQKPTTVLRGSHSDERHSNATSTSAKTVG